MISPYLWLREAHFYLDSELLASAVCFAELAENCFKSFRQSNVHPISAKISQEEIKYTAAKE